MGSHRLLGTVRVASLQGLENGLMLVERRFGAAGLRAGLETVKTKLVVEFFHQQMFQPLVARAANDLEMEVLVLGALIVARWGSAPRDRRRDPPAAASSEANSSSRDPLGGSAARHPLQRLANREQLEQVLLRQSG